MANVSANIGANTQQAESSIGRLLASLRKLRQESSTGVGMKMFASDEVNKLSSALNQAIAAAGALNKLDLSQFDSSLRRSAELLKRNADNYLRAQQAMGNQGVAGRFAQHLGAGGNPLNPDFGKMFPGMQGAALQRQMDFYFKSMLRGTGMSGSYSGGGGRGGTTGHGGAAPGGGGGEGDGGGSTAILAGFGKMLAPILAAVSVGKLVSAGLTAARRNTEAEDTLMRMTRDGGTGAGIGRAGLRMDNQVGSLSEHFEFVGKRYGLSGTEAMQSAQVYAHAAQQNDRQNVAHGLNASAGFARAYGLNINQTAGGLGGLQRTGAIGNTQAAQNEFLLKMAQTLKSTGMTANADQAIDDLAQTVDQYISHDLATPSAGKLDEFAALRAVTYAMPGLSGKHGQNLLGQFDDNMRSDSNDARNIMMATALQRYGIEDPYAVQAIQAEGANFDLSTVPGSTAKPGMTYGQLAAEEAHRIATDASGGTTGDPRADYNRRAMERVVQSNLLGMPITGAQVPYEIYQQREKDKAKLVDSKAQLAQYGLTPESFTNTSGVKDAVDLMGMDNPEDVREVAKRYADRLDMTGAGGAARADINKLLEDANSDPEAIKKRTLEAMAQFGQHGSQTTTDRASQAEQDNALNAVGRVFMDEWNTTVETGSIALKEFARSTDGAKKALDGFKDWLNALVTVEDNPHGPPIPRYGLPDDFPLLPGEVPGERDAGEDLPPLRPFGSPPPGTGGGTPTPLGTHGRTIPAAPGGTENPSGLPLASTRGFGFMSEANASVTPTPVRNWNINPGTIPPDIANTSPTAPMPTAAETVAATIDPNTANTAPSGPAPEGSPMSWRNNNPGNLRGKYYGATGNVKGFATYATPQAGWDAMEKQLFRYYEGKTTGKPLQTVGDIVKTWAPAADGNNPGRYAAEVAGSLGVGVDDKIDINDEDFRHRLMGKIAGYEAGRVTPYGSNLGRGDTPQSGTTPTGTGGPGEPTDLRTLAKQRLDLIDQGDPKRREFSYDNLDPKFAENLKKFVEAGKKAGHGNLMDPISGNRGLAHQRRIKAEAVAAGEGNMAAAEGKSAHNFGKAGDLRYFNRTDPKSLAAGQWAMANAAQFDLQFPMNDPNARTYEPWHVTPKGYDHRQDPLFGVKEAELREIAAGKSTKTTKVAAAKQAKQPKVPTGTGGPTAKAKPDAPAAQAAVPADTGATTPSAPTEAAATAPADTGAAQTAVPADTGSPAVEAPADTGTASSKAGASATPGVDVPKLADVAPTEKTQTPEEAAAKAAKDADAARQAKAASVPKSREEVSRLAAKQKDDAPTTPTGAPKPATDARSLGFHGDGSGVNPENKASDAAQRAQQGLPPAPGGTDARSQGFIPNAPGDQQVDADANKVVAASNSSSFSGSVDVNVHNHNSQGVKTESKSTTLKAGSGGTDNIPKGVVTIGTAPAAPQ